MRYAVVFKTYSWDDFICRQAKRCAAATGRGDFFISIDETNGSAGPIPFDQVIRITNAELIASGLANRFEKGSLLWWNADYVHYQFHERYADYDYYVFIEYDAVVQGSVEPMLDRAASLGTDLITLPIRIPIEEWFWTRYHRQTYKLSDLRGSLISMSVFSQKAIRLLGQRRREMVISSRTQCWPSAEVFIPTEGRLANLRHQSFAEFGDVSHLDSFPPMLEEDLPADTTIAFLHPVLDRQRYISSILRHLPNLRSLIFSNSEVRRNLARFPPADYRPHLVTAARYHARKQTEEWLERVKLKLLDVFTKTQHNNPREI